MHICLLVCIDLGAFARQFPFYAAVLHKKNVVRIAANARSEERRALLGVLYDELARYGLFQFHHSLVFFCLRKEWEDRSAVLGDEFSIVKVMSSVSDDILRRARALHDTMFGATGKRVTPNTKVILLALCVFIYFLYWCCAGVVHVRTGFWLEAQVFVAAAVVVMEKAEDSRCCLLEVRQDWPLSKRLLAEEEVNPGFAVLSACLFMCLASMLRV